jgi:hypothetical protein
VRISDLQAGDQLTLSGTTTNNLFVAATVTVEASGTNSEVEVTAPPPATRGNRLDLGIVTIIGTVTHPLNASAQLVIRDPNDRSVHIYVSEDLVVRTKASYIPASQLKGGDSVTIKAYRDSDGNLIAQTIRMR